MLEEHDYRIGISQYALDVELNVILVNVNIKGAICGRLAEIVFSKLTQHLMHYHKALWLIFSALENS